MKRAGNLYSRIVDYENIRLAYYKAQKGKRLKKDVLIFRKNLDLNLKQLQKSLIDEQVNVGVYHFFRIFDPKERLICAAAFKERILHHAVMNVLDPLFEKFQIYDSYACRKGKGTHGALHRALYFTKRYRYFIKFDVRKYFDSIDNAQLMLLLRKKIKDRKVLRLLGSIIGSYQISPGRGLPIGNLTSQYFANFYLGYADRLIKESLGIRGYIRYMDDMILWSDSMTRLQTVKGILESFLANDFRLQLKPAYSNCCHSGVPFLGFLIKPKGIYLLRKSKLRFSNHVREYYRLYNKNIWNESTLAEHLKSIVGWTLIAKAQRFRYTVFRRYGPQDRTA